MVEVEGAAIEQQFEFYACDADHFERKATEHQDVVLEP